MFGLEGIDSPSASVTSAIARGDAGAIENLLTTLGEDLSPGLRQTAQNALQKLRSKAGDWIAKKCKGSINREFPDQFRSDTLEAIKNAARAGDKAAKKAWKLLNDSRFQK